MIIIVNSNQNLYIKPEEVLQNSWYYWVMGHSFYIFMRRNYGHDIKEHSQRDKSRQNIDNWILLEQTSDNDGFGEM